MYDGFSKLRGFKAVQQDGIYVGIEDPYFGVIGVCCRSPDCVECSDGPAAFLIISATSLSVSPLSLLIMLPR